MDEAKRIQVITLEGYLNASPGMLMGMHNAASTTLALGAVMHRQDEIRTKMVTLRSSDDSMTLHISQDHIIAATAIEMEKRSLKMLGVNLSPDKCFMFDQGFGEYTSWYQDGTYMAQYGVETSTLRPQGTNPPDDVFSIAKGSAIAQQNFEINPLGAT